MTSQAPWPVNLSWIGRTFSAGGKPRYSALTLFSRKLHNLYWQGTFEMLLPSCKAQKFAMAEAPFTRFNLNFFFSLSKVSIFIFQLSKTRWSEGLIDLQIVYISSTWKVNSLSLNPTDSCPIAMLSQTVRPHLSKSSPSVCAVLPVWFLFILTFG